MITLVNIETNIVSTPKNFTNINKFFIKSGMKKYMKQGINIIIKVINGGTVC